MFGLSVARRTEPRARHRAAAVLLATGCLAATSLPVTTRASAATAVSPQGYVSIMFAHTGELVRPDCSPDPQGVSLDTITQAFTARGMAPTGTLVSSWVGRCMAAVPLQPVPKYITVPSWQVLQGMTSNGWGFIPHSRTYPDVTGLDAVAQHAEICGSKSDLVGHGMTGAAAMFAYPNNFSNSQTQSVAQGCHYYEGRKYTSGVNTLSTLTAGRYVGTHSVNGGWCRNPSLPCHDFQGPMVKYDYEDIGALEARASAVAPGQWLVIQFYRAITGSGPDGDCTSPDWHDHWAVGTEYMCWNDILAVLDAVPTTAGVVHPIDAERGLGLTRW